MASLNTTFGTNKGIKGQLNNELKEIKKAYDTTGYQNLTDSLINATNDYAKQQTDIQNQQTEQAIKEINQNKEYQQQDYLKEQKGAYTDYAKQTDKFANEGTNFRHSGVSETAKTQMYTAYQNRVATARDTYNRAVTNYDNQITNARLQNNAKLAEIAYQALQSKLQLSIESFQYMQNMRINQYNTVTSARDRAYNRWADNRNYKSTFSSGSGGGSSYSYNTSGSSNDLTNGGTLNKGKDKNNTKGNTKNQTKSTKSLGGGGKGSLGNGGSFGGRGTTTKYTSNSTPIGLKGKSLQASNKLAKQVQKNGYVTAKQLINATKGLSKKEQQVLLASYKTK